MRREISRFSHSQMVASDHMLGSNTGTLATSKPYISASSIPLMSNGIMAENNLGGGGGVTSSESLRGSNDENFISKFGNTYDF